MSGILHLISMSSGKDSTATALLAILTMPLELLRFVFADTGNEDPAVYAYLDYLERALGITIVRLKRDFSEWMRARRLFVANDRRVRRRRIRERNKWTGKVTTRVVTVRHTNKQKRRILGVLHPTGNPYLDLCLIKGRFPSRKAQFCTQFLKTEPLTEYAEQLIEQGFAVWSWQGVRADESENRRHLKSFEEVGGGLYINRPILRWTAQDSIDAHAAMGIVPNPLYSEGFDRVGCMPCINASKKDIRNIAARRPGEIERIGKVWEPMVRLASKRGASSFFPAPDDGRGERVGRNIYQVVEWAKTTRGGRQFDLLGNDEPSGCASSYGLCDSSDEVEA